tara:strand:- start:1935 stop:2705 length:771 start_codon:yes stop_codon:yes gene_type:complete
MKVVILAGGLGTRISEESQFKPKPMIEIGGKPILWHIMKTYSHYGINEFIICLGYKGYVIKEYFSNYFLHTSDVTIDIKKNKLKMHNSNSDPWKITLVDTGIETMTGGRLKRVSKYLKKNETFCFTYGDGLSDINIKELIAFHAKNKRIATVTAVPTPGRFGVIKTTGNKVIKFSEKPKKDGTLINGGFFVLNQKVIKYIDGDKSVWEEDVLPLLSKADQLSAFKHHSFWQPMDTLREKNYLNGLWNDDRAPWKLW